MRDFSFGNNHDFIKIVLRERAFDYVVTVTAPLSGGYVHTQIMIMMQNYDVSNHYSEIES